MNEALQLDTWWHAGFSDALAYEIARPIAVIRDPRLADEVREAYEMGLATGIERRQGGLL